MKPLSVQFPFEVPPMIRPGTRIREKDVAGFSNGERGNEFGSTDGSTPLGKERGNRSEASRPAPRPTTSGKAPFILKGATR